MGISNHIKFCKTLILVLSVAISTAMVSTVFAVGDTSSLDISVSVEPVISILALDTNGNNLEELNFDITPVSGGKSTTKTVVLRVDTTNPTGYELYMQSDYDDSGAKTTSLVGANSVIPTSTTSASNFWNYSASWNESVSGITLSGSTGAKLIPNYGNPDVLRDDVTTAVNNSLTTTDVTVNADTSIPSGAYKNELVFTAVANYVPPRIPAFWQITTMQEMTPEVCNSVYTPSSATGSSAIIVDKASALAGGYDAASTGGPYIAQHTLRDVRDGNVYTVRKLADGNCWMTENLKLGNTENQITLSSSDSDVANNTILPVAEHGTSNHWAASWLDAAGATSWHTYATGNNTYGNVYNWYTATAGTGNPSDTSGDASGSICAKNWGLPVGSGNKSWDNLINAYGIQTANMELLLALPVSFVKSGIYFYDSGYGADEIVAIYWTKTSTYLDVSLVADAIDADYNYDPGYLNTKHTGAKVDGYAVRCVAN